MENSKRLLLMLLLIIPLSLGLIYMMKFEISSAQQRGGGFEMAADTLHSRGEVI